MLKKFSQFGLRHNYFEEKIQNAIIKPRGVQYFYRIVLLLKINYFIFTVEKIIFFR